MEKIGEWVDVKQGIPTDDNWYVITFSFDGRARHNEYSQRVVSDEFFKVINGEFCRYDTLRKDWLPITNPNFKILAYAKATLLEPYKG